MKEPEANINEMILDVKTNQHLKEKSSKFGQCWTWTTSTSTPTLGQKPIEPKHKTGIVRT